MVAFIGFEGADTENLKQVKKAMAEKAATGDVAAATAFAELVSAEANRVLASRDGKLLLEEYRRYDERDYPDGNNLERAKSAMVKKAAGGDVAAAQALAGLVSAETSVQKVVFKALDAFDKSPEGQAAKAAEQGLPWAEKTSIGIDPRVLGGGR
jgi:hypothetical protein